MNILPNYLTVISSEVQDESSLIKNIKLEIRKHKSVQKDVDLIYVLDQSTYKLPLQYSSDKKLTKWETFALKKGIKKTKGKFVYDEETKSYISRYGATSKKNMEIRSAVVEDKGFNELRHAKRERIKKNLKN